MTQVGRAPSDEPPLPGRPVQVRAVPSSLFLETQSSPASSSQSRRNPQISVRELQQSVHGPQQPTAPHPNAPRWRPFARLSRVWQDVCHVVRAEAAYTHTLKRKAVPV